MKTPAKCSHENILILQSWQSMCGSSEYIEERSRCLDCGKEFPEPEEVIKDKNSKTYDCIPF